MHGTRRGRAAARSLTMVAALAALLAGCQRGTDAVATAEVADAAPPGRNTEVSFGADGQMVVIENGVQVPAEQALSQAPPAGPMPAPLDTSQLVPVQIIDPQGFGQPVVVASLQIPAGWQATGGVQWIDANCVGNMSQLAWTAIAPDSLTAVEIMPGYTWQVQGTQIDMNPCPVAAYRSLREMMEATLRNVRPGAHVLEYQDLPDKARDAEAGAQAAGGPPQGIQARYEAGRMLVSYAKDGVAMREVLQASAVFSQAQGNIVGAVNSITASRAPAGRLDFGLVERLAQTMQPNDQWGRMMIERKRRTMEEFAGRQRRQIDEWHNRQMALINARGAADRHAIRMRTNQEVAGIYGAIAANTSATNDTIHRRALEATGSYNTYAGAGGEPVKVSIHSGDNVFQRSDGTVFTTDSPYYQPTDATRLERVP